MGHSLGGLVALFAARAAPDRVRSLSPLCTIASGRIATRLTPWMAVMGIRSRVGTRRMRRRAFLRLVLSPAERREVGQDDLAERLGTLFGRDLAHQPDVILAQLSALRGADAAPWLGELSPIPTLVVSAEHDRIAPAWAGRALAAGIPGARFELLGGAALGVTVTQPERVNGLLAAHLAEAEAARHG